MVITVQVLRTVMKTLRGIWGSLDLDNTAFGEGSPLTANKSRGSTEKKPF